MNWVKFSLFLFVIVHAIVFYVSHNRLNRTMKVLMIVVIAFYVVFSALYCILA